AERRAQAPRDRHRPGRSFGEGSPAFPRDRPELEGRGAGRDRRHELPELTEGIRGGDVVHRDEARVCGRGRVAHGLGEAAGAGVASDALDGVPEVLCAPWVPSRGVRDRVVLAPGLDEGCHDRSLQIPYRFARSALSASWTFFSSSSFGWIRAWARRETP